MSEVPRGVMITVRQILDDMPDMRGNYEIGKAIERAILAERRRCAAYVKMLDISAKQVLGYIEAGT